MTYVLWDASALAKLYVPEEGSATAADVLTRAGTCRMITTLVTYAETLSVLLRKRNGAEISPMAFQRAAEALRNDVIESPTFEIAAVSDTDFLEGTGFVLRHNLNATDAAILSVYLRQMRVQAVGGDRSILIASDRRLLRAAEAEGLPTIDPETSSPGM